MLQPEETWLYQKGLEKGLNQSRPIMIKAIAALAEFFGTPLSPQREAALQQSSVEELLALIDRIQQNRRLDD